MGYLDSDGNYYEGDRQGDDLEYPAPPSQYHSPVDGGWELDIARYKGDRIAQLQSTYDSDQDSLNKAWLSAMIADGSEETARKTAIEGEMTALDAQLDLDILTIIMEE